MKRTVKDIGAGLIFLGFVLIALSGDSIDFMGIQEYIKRVVKLALPIYIGFVLLLAVDIKDRISKAYRRKSIIENCRARVKFSNLIALTTLKED